jgi:NADH-quinone oxidoreductase subunit N
MMTISWTDLNVILPVVVVVVSTLLLVLVDLWVPANRKDITALLAALGLTAGLGVSLARAGEPAALGFNGMVAADSFATFLNVLFFGSGIVAVMVARDYLRRMEMDRGDFYPLLMLSVAGMALMAQAHDLIVVFLALEMLSIPLYVLSGYARPRTSSHEASLKYFLLGTFSSAFMLYGIGLVFGATASTGLDQIVAAAATQAYNPWLFLVGASLILVGFGFKMAAVPFHVWSPDVYQGAPTPVTAFMSVGAKAAGVAAMVRVFLIAFPGLAVNLTPILWTLAALTMVVGNVAALTQTNIKRLLAYSSIAHGGYILMAFVVYGQPDLVGDAVGAMLFYLVVYALSSFGAWSVVMTLERKEEQGLALEDFAGLGRRNPWMGFAMLVFMLSFTGMPLTLGFWGKFYLFRSAVAGGFTGLAVIGVLASVVSAFYYLRVVVNIFMRPGEAELPTGTYWVQWVAVVAAAAVVLLSFVPGPLIDLAAQVLDSFL